MPKDYAEAERWTRKAAEQGRAVAQYNLGWMYLNGLGVPRDHAEAAKWYRMAAEQKEAEALISLGLMYARGDGVPQDDTEAQMWFSLVPPQGPKRAAELRDNFAERLTPAQLAEAQRLAREWTEEHGQANAAQRSIATVVEAAAVAADTILARIVALVPPLKSAPAIVGAWQSAPVLGQLGLIQVTMTFNEVGSVTSKSDFISFPSFKPDLEYFWHVSKGTYSIDRNEATVIFDETWAVRKMRGEDETIGPKESNKRTQVFHLAEGKLVTKDLVLERLKEVDPGELAALKRITGSSERTGFERLREVVPGELAAQAYAQGGVALNRFVGTWENIDRNTNGITRIEIQLDGTSPSVHVFGKCHPSDCDWGSTRAEVYGTGVGADLPQNASALRAIFDPGFAVTTLTMWLRRSGKLRVEALTRFTDKSGRSNYASIETFVRRQP